MPEQFWDYAEKLASVVSSYIVKEGEEISLFQKLYGHKSNIKLICPFGCHAFAHIPQMNRTKLMPKACPVIYLGPSEKINGYILYDHVKKTIFESSSVVFDEYVFGVSNLLKLIDRGNIPHYFDTYLNEKFIDFSKLSDCDNVLSTNTNPVDCVHENPDDFAEIVIDDDYPVDVERENRIGHSTPALENLHSKHTALNEKTHSTDVYSDDNDDEMVLLSMPPPDFTQSDGSYTPTSSSCSSSSSSSSLIADTVQAVAAPDPEIFFQITELDMKDEESEGTDYDSADENEPELLINLNNYEMFDYPPDDHDPDPYDPADQSASPYSSSTYNSETDPEVDFNLVTQSQPDDEINISEPNESDDAAEEVRHSAHFQDPDYQHSAIGKAFSALKIPWNMFGEPDHGYKDLDFLDYAFHADQVVNDKVTP